MQVRLLHASKLGVPRACGPCGLPDRACDLGHAAAARHTIKKSAGTNNETISIPVGLCMASSYVLFRSTADRSIRLGGKHAWSCVAARSQEL